MILDAYDRCCVGCITIKNRFFDAEHFGIILLDEFNAWFCDIALIKSYLLINSSHKCYNDSNQK